MSFFLLLNFLLLIQQSFQISEGDTFLINYEKYNRCMEPLSASIIMLNKCNQGNKKQTFKWTSSQQILNMGLKLCLGASADFSQLEFSSCNQTSELQKWACVNYTFPAIRGQNWFLSYGARGIQLKNVTDVKATWKIDGTEDSLCTKGFEPQFTIGSNSYGAPCEFPFKYMNEWYVECTTVNNNENQLWCGTTADVDKDELTGFCPVKGDNDVFWIRNHWTGNQYQVNSHSALTWLQARKSCQQQNSELLSITELHEQTYLAGLTSADTNTGYWIGLNSLDMVSGWQWVGNRPFRYLNWAPGSPSPESEKICATMQSQSGKWENKECGHKLGYICKKENSSLNTTVISSDDSKPVNCPDSWYPYSGHCYRLFSQLKSWNGALLACRKEDGDLASIHNIEEHSFVISQDGYNPTATLWIGLNAQKTERYFEWSDGTHVGYTKWQRGEPTYLQDSMDNCVIMSGENGYWMDTFCQEEYGYICKRKPLKTLPKPVGAELGCQKGWKRHGFYCYLIGQTLGMFSEAKKFCERNKGSLVFIEDRYEQAYLTSLVGLRQEKYFWIGISEINDGWTFNWTNGHLVIFSHWNSRMPEHKHGCVAMRTGTAAGLWDVVSCDEKAAFICKQQAEGVTLPLAPTTVPPPSCPEGWSETEITSSCFKIFREKKHIKRTWFEARDFCREIGGDLASTHSREEQSKIEELIEDETWIGLSILDSDIGYAWSDGSPVDVEFWHPWISHKTNEGQQCATLRPHFPYWSTSSCSRLYHWVCQVKRGVALKAEPNDTFAGSYQLIEDGWVKYEDNEYYFHNTTLPMREARGFCKQRSGDLAVITSEKEQMFLWKYNVFHASNEEVYIGLIVGLDGKFQWLDGTLVTYAAWAPNEPNNANEEEECVEMYPKTGLWNDIYCSAERRFICERHNSSVRSTAAPTQPAPSGGCPEGWLWFNNKCFQIFGFNEEERKNWSAARTACKTLEGNLATIPSTAVQAFLTMHLKNVPVDSWIGLHDIIEEGRFLWTDGSSVRYTNWVKGPPSHSSYSPNKYWADCVTMIKKPEKWAGSWKARRCSIKFAYICQKNTDTRSSHSEATTPASGYIPYGNSSYWFTEAATWEEARKECHLKHSELTSILNPYTQSFLWILLLNKRQPIWIGLNSNVTNENYRWLFGWKLEYNNWAPGEPKENLDCVYLDVDGQWKTATCNKEYSAVCEQYNGTAPTDYPQVPGRCPKSQSTPWIPFRAHCYAIILDQNTWAHSSMKCSQLGGSLASIEDSAEMKFLKEHIQYTDEGNFWIGLLQNVNGEWIWKDNTAVDFVNWNTGEPRNGSEFYYYYSPASMTLCAAISSGNGKWLTSRCHRDDKGYICKTRKIIEAMPTEVSPNNGEKRESSPSAHGMVAMAVILVFILTAAGIAGYIFYKRRRRQQVIVAGFDNSLYRDNVVMIQNNDQDYLVENFDNKQGH